MVIFCILYFPFKDVFRLMTPGGGGYGEPKPTNGLANESGKSDGHPSKRRRTDPVASQHYHERGSVHAYRLAQESA